MSDLPPPTRMTRRGARLLGGPYNGQVVPIIGARLIGPTAIFENGYISGPVGTYRWAVGNGGEYIGEWEPSHV